MQGHIASRINRNVPARLDLFKQHHLQPLTAPARAPQAYRPIFIAIASHDTIPEWQLLRKHVASHDLKRTAGHKGRDEPAPPKRSPFHATLRRCARAGSPSSGSVTPKATGNRFPAVN